MIVNAWPHLREGLVVSVRAKYHRFTSTVTVAELLEHTVVRGKQFRDDRGDVYNSKDYDARFVGAEDERARPRSPGPERRFTVTERQTIIRTYEVVAASRSAAGAIVRRGHARATGIVETPSVITARPLTRE